MRFQRYLKNILSFVNTSQIRLRKSGLSLQKGARIGIGVKVYIGRNGKFIMGEDSFCNANITVLADAKLEVGSKTMINKGTVIGTAKEIFIGQGVMIAHGVTIYDNNNHPVDLDSRIDIAQKKYPPELISWKNSTKKMVRIEDYVWIGMHSTILKGVTIGKGAIVAACSVVVNDVPEMTMVGGNPARILKRVN